AGRERRVLAQRHAQAGRAAGGHGLAVLAHELGIAGDRALGHPDPVDPLDLVEDLLGHGVADLAGVEAAEGLLGADGHVDALGDLLEEVVEAGRDGVGEHVGGGHEADPEHEGRGGRAQPQLVGQEALERRLAHGRRQPPSFFIRSSTFSAVGLAISSTMRPSARHSTWSAQAAELRLPVGWSANTIAGLEASARAAATRCCWPPDSSAGLWLRRSRSPTASNTRWNPPPAGFWPARG